MKIYQETNFIETHFWFVLILMSDLVGYSSIALVCLITLIIALYRPSISSIIFTALAVRLFVLFLAIITLHCLIARRCKRI